jgi:hypothetical protein
MPPWPLSLRVPTLGRRRSPAIGGPNRVRDGCIIFYGSSDLNQCKVWGDRTRTELLLSRAARRRRRPFLQDVQAPPLSSQPTPRAAPYLPRIRQQQHCVRPAALPPSEPGNKQNWRMKKRGRPTDRTFLRPALVDRTRGRVDVGFSSKHGAHQQAVPICPPAGKNE